MIFRTFLMSSTGSLSHFLFRISYSGGKSKNTLPSRNGVSPLQIPLKTLQEATACHSCSSDSDVHLSCANFLCFAQNQFLFRIPIVHNAHLSLALAR